MTDEYDDEVAVEQPPAFAPTDEQFAALDLFREGETMVIDAGAGTGKTSTLMLLAADTQASGQYIAFNKAIVNDVQRKLPDTCAARTAHSLAYGVVGKHFAHRLRSDRIRSSQMARILGLPDVFRITYAGEPKDLSGSFLAGTVMASLRKFCQTADLAPGAEHFSYIKGIDAPTAEGQRTYANNDRLREFLAPYLDKAWADVQNVEGHLRYGHEHYLKAWQLRNPRIPADYIMFDEAQDASPVMAAIVAAQTHAQCVYVGDRNQAIYGFTGAIDAMEGFDAEHRSALTQCQPTGTMVRIPVQVNGREWSSREVPIERISSGDLVVSWMGRKGLRRRGSAVTDVAVRQFDGELVVARAGDAVSRYAPNHECVVVLGDLADGDHVVYMMRRGGQYRVGRCPWRYSNGVAPIRRAVAEGADAMWVLSVHETEGDAALHEALAQVQYGVPAQGWANPAHYKMPLDEFWAKVGDNRAQAADCLAHHDLLIEYPLWSRNDPHGVPGGGWSTRLVTAAANVRSGMKMLVPGRAGESNGSVNGFVPWSAWTPVEVTYEWYSGSIYSLSVDTDHTYVADGIVTHNSFRFGPAIALEANLVLAQLGSDLMVRGLPELASRVDKIDGYPDAVLCRTNASTIVHALHALADGHPFHLVGGGKELIAFARGAKMLGAPARPGVPGAYHGRPKHPDLACFASWHEVREYVDNDPEGIELKLLVRLIEEHGVDTIIDAIEQMVPEGPGVLSISTSHKAKGREWDRVRLAKDMGLFGDTEDELRLRYVAMTRARLELDLTQYEEGLAERDERARR